MKWKCIWGLTLMVFLVASLLPSEKKKSKKKVDTQNGYVEVREEIVVTATMSQKPLKLCSRTLSILNASDLDVIPSASALSLLGNMPGVFVHRSGDFGRADPDIRGIGQNGRRVAVLVNGRPEKMGIFGCAVSHAFPLDNVERVEVVRGPASVLYGGEAMGGVIHIRTRLPEAGFENRFQLSAGSFQTREMNLRHGGVINRLKYLLTLDHRRSDGFRPNSAYAGDSFTGQWTLDTGSGGMVKMSAKYFAGDKEEPGPLESPTPEYFTRYHRGAVDLGFSRKLERSDWEVRLYRNFGHHRFSDGWNSRDHTSGGFLRYSTRGLSNHSLSLGVDARTFGGRSLGWPVGEWSKWEWAVFCHDDWVLDSRWIASAGIRLHRDSVFGSILVPRMGLVFAASDNLSLRLSFSRGFRSPQINELYMFPTSNPDLKPETMWSLEAGMEYRLNDALTMEATVFRMQGRNLIRLVPNAAATPPFRFENIDDFVFSGVEVGVRTRLFPHLTLGINYSFLETGAWTRGRPGHQWGADLRWRNRRAGVFLQGKYISDYHAGDRGSSPLPDYFLCNGRITFTVVKGVEARLDLLNLTDEAYLIYGEFPGVATGTYPMPGRQIRLGVVLTL